MININSKKSFFFNNIARKKVFFNIIWLLFDNVIKLIGGLFIGILVARHFGPIDFGIYNYSLSILSFFLTFSSIGLDNIVLRELVNQKENADEILGTVFVIKTIACFLSYLIIFLGILYSGSTFYNNVITLIVSSGLFFQAFDTLSFLFQADIQSKTVVIVKNLAYVIIIIIKILIIYLNLSLYYLAWSIPVEALVIALGLMSVYKLKKYDYKKWKFNKHLSLILIRDSWPLLLTNIGIVLYMRIDQIMIGNILGVKEVGVYSVGVKLVELWYFIPNAIIASFFPGMVALYKTDIDLFYSKLQKLYNLMAFISYLIVIPSVIYAKKIIFFMYGDKYEGAETVFIILIINTFFVFLAYPRTIFLNTVNWSKVYLLIAFSGSFINIILNVFLIPYYGIEGAAWASLVAYIITGYVSCFMYKPLFKNGKMMTKAFICPKFWSK